MRIDTLKIVNRQIYLLLLLVIPAFSSPADDVANIQEYFQELFFSRENWKYSRKAPIKDLENYAKLEEFLSTSLIADYKNFPGARYSFSDSNTRSENNNKLYWTDFINTFKEVNETDGTLSEGPKDFLLPEIAFKMIIDTVFFNKVTKPDASANTEAAVTDGKQADVLNPELGFSDNNQAEVLISNINTLIGYFKGTDKNGQVTYTSEKNTRDNVQPYLLIANIMNRIDSDFKQLFEIAYKGTRSANDEIKKRQDKVRGNLEKTYIKLVDASRSLLKALEGLFILRKSLITDIGLLQQIRRVFKNSFDSDDQQNFILAIEKEGLKPNDKLFMTEQLEKLEEKYLETKEYFNYPGKPREGSSIALEHRYLSLVSKANSTTERKNWEWNLFKTIRESLYNDVKISMSESLKPFSANESDSNINYRNSVYFNLAELYLLASGINLTSENGHLHKRIRATINLLMHILAMFNNAYTFSKNEKCFFPVMDLFSNMESVSKNEYLAEFLKTIIETPVKQEDPVQVGETPETAETAEITANEDAAPAPALRNRASSFFWKQINRLPFTRSAPTPNPIQNPPVSLTPAKTELLNMLQNFQNPKNLIEELKNKGLESDKSVSFFKRLAELLLISTSQHDSSLEKKEREKAYDTFIKRIESIENFVPRDTLIHLREELTSETGSINKVKIPELLKQLHQKEIPAASIKEESLGFLLPIIITLSVVNVVLISFSYVAFSNSNKSTIITSDD